MMFLSLTNLTYLPQFDVPPILLPDSACNCLCQWPIVWFVIPISRTTMIPWDRSVLWLTEAASAEGLRKYVQREKTAGIRFEVVQNFLPTPQQFLFLAFIIPVDIQQAPKTLLIFFFKYVSGSRLVSYHVTSSH